MDAMDNAISLQDMTVGIIGCGMIGDSLSVLTTGHGLKTVCLIRNEQKIPSYRQKYDFYFGQMIEQQVLTEETAKLCSTYLSYTTDYDALKDCDVIFECVVEDLEVKHNVYARLEESCQKVKAVCSVSSSFLPDRLEEKCSVLKGKIVITHPFNPAHMVPFFEICGGKDTEEGLCEWVRDFLKTLDRKPIILNKPVPGFVGNYLQFALWAAALRLVETGVCAPEDIDTCLQYSFCPRYTQIGIFEHFDNGGYRLNRTTCDNVFPILPRYDAAPDMIVEKAESPDAWGAASPEKKGFYDWAAVDMAAYANRVSEPYWKFCKWAFPEKALGD